MEYFLIVLAICFIFFLFYIHYSAKEDFVLIRKNISLEQLFDIAFLTGFSALFAGRLLYVLFHPSIQFLNPLVFFGLPYFPGLSLPGAILGGGAFLVVYGRKTNIPAGRIADFFSVAFLLSMPLGFVVSAFLSEKKDFFLFLLAAGLSAALFIFFAKLLLPKLLGGQYKDGTVTYLFFMNFPLVFLLSHIISRASLRQFYFTPEDGVLLLSFLLGLILYMRQEHASTKKRIAK